MAADLDIGDKTCGGYPAFNVSAVPDARADAQLRRDAEDLASWGVDALKVDGCNADPVSAATAGLGRHPCCRALADTVAATEPHARDVPEARPRPKRHRPTHPLRLLLAGCVGTAACKRRFPLGLLSHRLLLQCTWVSQVARARWITRPSRGHATSGGYTTTSRPASTMCAGSSTTFGPRITLPYAGTMLARSTTVESVLRLPKIPSKP